MRIIITGASSGLGEALAYHYATSENELILLARRQDRLEKVAQICREKGAKVAIYAVDVNDFVQLKSIAYQIAIGSIDRIILNAGISLGHAGGISPFEEFYRLFQTNFLSLHAILEPMIPKLKEQAHGEIVFISSLASLITMPTSVAYSSSKRAMNAYAEGLRYQLRPFGIEVMTILPGFIDSEMTQKNKFKMPFFLSTDQGIKRITRAIEQKKRFYPFPLRFYLILRVTLMLPQFLRDRIVNFTNFKKG